MTKILPEDYENFVTYKKRHVYSHFIAKLAKDYSEDGKNVKVKIAPKEELVAWDSCILERIKVLIEDYDAVEPDFVLPTLISSYPAIQMGEI